MSGARRPRGGVTSPTPRWSAGGNLGRQRRRWQRRRIQGSLHPPSRPWSRMSDRMKGQRVAAFGRPPPRRGLTGEGDLLAAETRLVAHHSSGAALALQAVAHGGAMVRPQSSAEAARSCRRRVGWSWAAPRLSIYGWNVDWTSKQCTQQARLREFPAKTYEWIFVTSPQRLGVRLANSPIGISARE